MKARESTLKRKTTETDIEIYLNLDGNGKSNIDTGIGFFDHMLTLFACHSGFDLNVVCKGDLSVDGHHTVEDVGIALGNLLAKTLGDKKGIVRYACSYVPMDESLCRTVIDISGRPFLSFDADLSGKTGDFDLELVKEFFRAITSYGFVTVHIDLLKGENSHHKSEAIFKSFAHALSDAVKVIGDKIPSSKGVL